MNPNLRLVSFIAAARANNALDLLFRAETLPDILKSYHMICDELCLKPDVFGSFYPILKTNLKNWKSKEIFEKLDARAGHECYDDNLACRNTKVLVIGAGPCGLRTAIEAQLLGAKVIVIEKRNYMSRNNVLRLWSFVIEDLRSLGAKQFVRKFCMGSINHVSIRQLQCMLLKIALLLGVEVHTEVSFENLIEPNCEEKTGWRAKLSPLNHPVSKYEFDVIVGADGGRSSFSKDFKQKELRSKLAIAITVNFVNKRTEDETKVPEISGISYIYNQNFFKMLGTERGIDLENIIYYKNDTHYFVMTPKKSSLIAKGVIKEDLVGAELLAPDNVNQEALRSYAKEAAEFSTKHQLPNLEFAVNHYGKPDVSLFDFSTMYAAENSSKVVVRSGYKLLKLLVGDGLLQPFWPTGSGCARGFLSSLDAVWAMKAWSCGVEPLDVLAERESIFKLLAQTTSDNLNKNLKAFTLDPCTRYQNLNKTTVSPQQVLYLYDSDEIKTIIQRKEFAEVHSNEAKSRCKPVSGKLAQLKCKSVDAGLGSSSNPNIPSQNSNCSPAWNRSKSDDYIAKQNNKQNFPKTESFAKLVSKFQSFASSNQDHQNLRKIINTPINKSFYAAKSSTPNSNSKPAARRSIFTVTSPTLVPLRSKSKYSKNIEQATGLLKFKENNSTLKVTPNKEIKRSTPVKRRSSLMKSLKRLRRSSFAQADKLELDLKEANEDDGLNAEEPPPHSTEKKLRISCNRKESSFRSPSQHLSRKLAFKTLRDQYEFGNLENDNSNSKQLKRSTRNESIRFGRVTNFVSNIFSTPKKNTIPTISSPINL